MNYNDNGEIKPISIKAGDSLPIGTVVEFEGSTVPAGYVEVPDNSEIYSTEERRIGKWIDGKPLYRRTFNIPRTTIDQNNPTTITLLNNNNLNPINMYGIIKYASSGLVYPLGGSTNRDTVGHQVRWSTNALLQVIISTIQKAEGSVESGYVTFEYTKTAD